MIDADQHQEEMVSRHSEQIPEMLTKVTSGPVAKEAVVQVSTYVQGNKVPRALVWEYTRVKFPWAGKREEKESLSFLCVDLHGILNLSAG